MNDGNKSKAKYAKVTVSFILCPLLISFALAHQPYWNQGSPLEQPFIIERITISKALFGDLDTEETDYFKFDVPEGLTIEFSLFVGGRCSEQFQPQLYLLSPDAKDDLVSFTLPDGYKATQAEGAWESYQSHGLIGRRGPGIRKTFSAGTYYLAVQSNNKSGFYLISLSGSENFGAGPGGREAIPRFNACK